MQILEIKKFNDDEILILNNNWGSESQLKEKIEKSFSTIDKG